LYTARLKARERGKKIKKNLQTGQNEYVNLLRSMRAFSLSVFTFHYRKNSVKRKAFWKIFHHREKIITFLENFLDKPYKLA